MTSTLGRPLGRPRSRASLLGHPGTSAGEGWPVFLLPPVPPPPRTALWCGGLLTLTLRGKAMDGFEEQQERTRPQLSPPSLENRRTDAGFPQASIGRRRSVAGRSLGLSSQTTEQIQSTEVRRWRHNQPVHSIGAGPPARIRSIWSHKKLAAKTKPMATIPHWRAATIPLALFLK